MLVLREKLTKIHRKAELKKNPRDCIGMWNQDSMPPLFCSKDIPADPGQYASFTPCTDITLN